MFAVKEAICYAGGSLCEDAIGYGDTYIFAIDGASCLTGQNLVDPVSDAAWFANQTKQQLCAALDSGDNRTTGTILQEIVAGLKDIYLSAAQQQGLPIPQDSPSAGIALFRQMGNQIEFFGLGDCVGAITTKSRQTHVFCDSVLPQLDKTVLEKMAQLHAKTKKPLLDTRQDCTQLLISNRNLRNQPSGYWILDLSGVGIEHAIHWSIPLVQADKISVFSDGFEQLAGCFGKYQDDVRLHLAMHQNSLNQMYQQLYRLQEEDPQANNFPRFKLRDDACAITANITV